MHKEEKIISIYTPEVVHSSFRVGISIDHFSGSYGAIGPYVCLCVRTFERYDIWPRYMTNLVHLDAIWKSLNVKQSSRSQEKNVAKVVGAI